MWDRLKPITHPQKGHRPRDMDDGGEKAKFAQSHTRGVSGGNKTYSYSIRPGPAPPRPPRPTDLTEQLNKDAGSHRTGPQVPPKGLDHLRSSQYRPASSVYSQPSPLTTQFAPQVTSVNARYRATDDNDVSPPSSPEVLTPRDDYHESLDISPIDEVPDMSQLGSNALDRPGSHTRQQRRNIPTIRRERPRNHEQAATNLGESKSRDMLLDQAQGTRPHHDPRWDPITGELTTATGGRPSQIPKPAEYAHGLGITRNPNSNSFSDRMRRNLGTHGPKVRGPEPLDERPAWNGASGRTALVASVKDTTEVAPLRVPPKSARRLPRPAEDSPFGTTSPPVSPETVGLGAPIRRKEVQSASPGSPATRDTLAYPSPPHSGKPLNAGTKDAFSTYEGPATAAPPPHPHQDISTGIDDSPSAKRHQRRQQQQQHQLEPPAHVPQKSWSSSVYSDATEPAPPPPLPTTASPAAPEVIPAGPWTQPPSRFSITTYATSAHESPRQSADFGSAPPIPEPLPQFTSVLDRSRPKIGGDNIGAKPAKDTNILADPIVISMKAPAFVASPTKSGPLRSNPILHPARSYTWDTEGKSSNSAAEILMSGALGRASSTSPTSRAFRRTSITSVSTNKELPPAPPELEENSKGDRVGILNARLSALANRRININRSIKQMTELMPTDNLLASKAVLAKREEEKRKVEALRMELAEVQREEYELGLKLHRAYKRLDRDESFERSTLWVRRATDA